MDAKKNEARFTIKFNPANPRHQEAIRTLNEAGRGKAALIADALCMYAHYGASMSADLLSSKEIIPAMQSTKICMASKNEKGEDDTLLNILADSSDMFFNQ